MYVRFEIGFGCLKKFKVFQRIYLKINALVFYLVFFLALKYTYILVRFFRHLFCIFFFWVFVYFPLL